MEKFKFLRTHMRRALGILLGVTMAAVVTAVQLCGLELTASAESEVKLMPNIHITATDITYGQTLADSTINGTATCNGETVPGTFAWKYPDTRPDAGERQAFKVNFTPNDTNVYDSVSEMVEITVNKAPAVNDGLIASIKVNPITYGTTLGK